MFLETMCIVKLFSMEKIKIKNNKFLKMISDYSLGIYIIHPFWLNIINKGLHIYPNAFPTLIGEFIFFIYALILSIISCWILYKMPFIKNIFGGKNEKRCKNNYSNT